jgi:hypothetical protein
VERTLTLPQSSFVAARRWHARARVVFALGLAALGGGCLVRAEPVAYVDEDYDGDGYYVDGAYADVYAAPVYAYGGVNYYWYNDYWWYRHGDRWVVLHNEPRGLYRYRTERWGHHGVYGGVGRARPYTAAPAYRAPARPHAAPRAAPHGGGRRR